MENENLIGLKTVSDIAEEHLSVFLKLFVLLYADDTVLLAESPSDLQTELNKFFEYCKLWQLKINTQKTKILVFSSGRPLANLKFHLDGLEIDIVNEFNYLGILCSRTGSFNKAIQKQAEKATKARCDILKKGRVHNLSI